MQRAADKGERSSNGRQARFEDCFREHYADILAFAIRRVHGRDQAEEVAADTFAVAWQRADQIPDPALPWLYGVGLKIIANQRRSQTRRQALSERIAHQPPPAGAALDESLICREAFSVAFARLTEREREVLRLVAWEQLNSSQAAAVLGCSSSAFRVRLHRARRKLAKHLRAGGHLVTENPRPTMDPEESQ
jgi:RNA polymerase sigma-70 factor (ECF subfamily)